MFGWPSFALPVDLCEKEREPPPLPVKPQFPSYLPRQKSPRSPLTNRSSDQLCSQIHRLKLPQNVTSEDVESLNVCMAEQVAVEDLVPPEFRNRPFQNDEALTIAIQELRYSLDDAFGAVLRLPKKGGRNWPRLPSTHAFFLALEEVSHYWDDSKDNYYEAPQDSETESEKDGSSQMRVSEEAAPESCSAKMKRVYKGRRTSNGTHMPEQILEKTVKGLLDICARPFRVQTVQKRMPTRLLIRNLRMPIVHNFDVGLVSKDNALARKGHIEGPLMGVFVRPEITFRGARDESPTAMEILDCYREIGALLLTAQKRAREGQKEVIAGTGVWWGQKSRWGGTRGGHMPYESDEEPTGPPSLKSPTMQGANDHSAFTDGGKNVIELRGGDNTRPSSAHNHITPQKRASADARPKGKENKPRGKKSERASPKYVAMMNRYRDLELGTSLWDHDIKYLQIGKEDGDFDTVFVVSAVNCHMCLMRMRVHGDYMRWLEKGTEASSETAAHGLRRDTLYVDRSRWFNFLVEEDRVEALTGVWRIMSWLLRSVGEGGERG